jgi:malate dehydrogenase (oxaloacetate-decarboxylating)
MTSDATFQIALRGDAILTNPRFNKGTAFTERERKDFGLLGRLPYRVNTLDEQCERAYAQFKESGRADPQISNLMQHSFLESLKQQNWVLYYSLISRHLTEMVPIIYTPTEVKPECYEQALFTDLTG